MCVRLTAHPLSLCGVSGQQDRGPDQHRRRHSGGRSQRGFTGGRGGRGERRCVHRAGQPGQLPWQRSMAPLTVGSPKKKRRKSKIIVAKEL